MTIDISSVAERSGLPASTLRFYEQKGLITSVGRRGNRRLFDEQVLQRLAFITLAGSAGLSLDEIAAMLPPEGDPQVDRATLSARAAEIDDEIANLTAMSSWLKHAARCPAADHMQCPSFLEYLAVARQRSTRPRRPGLLAQARSPGS